MNEYRYEEIQLGLKAEFETEISEEKMELFRKITGDINPMHTDADFARENGFDCNIAYGMLNASMLSTLAGVYIPGKYSLIHSTEITFVKPVMVGEVLKVCGEVIEKDDRYRFITIKVSICNESNIKVCRGKMKVGVLA